MGTPETRQFDLSKAMKRLLVIIKKNWAVLIILGLVLIFAFPYWAKHLVPFPGDYLVTTFPPWQYFYGLPVKNNAMPDVVTQMFPFKHLVLDYWQKGIVPLWNPNNFSGNPFLANYQSAVFHPMNWLFFIINQTDAWSMMILLQPLLAGLFTYLFVRQLKVSQAGALIASISFMFCGFITTWMAYGTLSYALLWLPLIFYAIEKSFSKRSSFTLAILSLALVASFFSGHFQTTLYVCGASAVYLVYKYWTTKNISTFLINILFVILGVGLASVQTVPTLELYQYSVRSGSYVIGEVIPWQWLITLIAPDFYGNQVTRNNWYGHYAEWLGFIGVIPLVLALYILLRKPDRQVRIFAFLGLAALVFTLPTPLIGILEKLHIPVISTSAASRLISIFSFSFAVLAGFGLDRLKSDIKNKKVLQSFLAVLPIFLVTLFTWADLLFLKPFDAEKISIAKRNLMLPTFFSLIPPLLLLIYYLVTKIRKKDYSRIFTRVLVIGIIFFSVFDLFRFAQKWVPFSARDYVYPTLPISRYLRQTVPPDRLFGYFGMELQNYYQVPGFSGYDPLYIRRYGQLLVAAPDGQIREPSTRGVSLENRAKYTMPLMNLMGGKYLLHAVADGQSAWAFPFWNYPGQFKQIYQDDKYEVYQNLAAFPRAFLVNNFQVVQDPQKIVDVMLSPDTDLRQTAILESPPQYEVSVQSSDQAASNVTITDYQPDQVDIKYQSDRTQLLFLSDNYYPGWQAYIDGQPTQIKRADYTFRAIVAPAGSHSVRYIYQPITFKVGLLISLISLILVIYLSRLLSFKPTQK
jgi:hypothetical protein